MSARRPRVFLGLTELSGYYSGLQEGFDELGIRCTRIALEAHPYGYRDTDWPRHVGAIRRVEAALAAPRRYRGLRVPPGLARLAALRAARRALRAALLLRALATHDVFVLGFARSFLSLRDLAVMHRLGKRIVHVFHGSDARPAYIDGAWSRGDVLDARWAGRVARTVADQRRSVEAVERHADVVICHGPMSQLFVRPFVPGLKLGVPVTVERADAAAGPWHGDGVRVLHCPSDPEAKGTPLIREAVAAVSRAGAPVDYVEISGRPHDEVLTAIAGCDIVIDQLYSDTPLAGVAAEAAWHGKAVLVAGYAAEVWPLGLDDAEVPPGEYCRPEAVADVLEALVRDAERRAAVGDALRRYVEERWRPAAVAGRLLDLARDGVAGWTVDPRPIVYCQGAGLSEATAQERIRRLVEWQGPSALQLDHKPELREAVLAFARAETVSSPETSSAS
jgi:glycosyltransferase involved in cell wall biosynthesis